MRFYLPYPCVRHPKPLSTAKQSCPYHRIERAALPNRAPSFHLTPNVPVRELFCYGYRMKRRFFNTVEAVGQAVREARREQGLTQGELASKAEVGRRFIVELEAGHLRAELGKVLKVLETLGIHAVALPSVRPSQRLDDIDLDEVMKRFD